MTNVEGRHVSITWPNGKQEQINVPTPTAWGLVVDRLLPVLKPGLIIALSGPLGAGKTTCVQALSLALGSTRPAQSPTFALMRSYPLKNNSGLKRLIHVDAYRIENERELAVLDLDEELADHASVLVIEWPEQIPKWITRHAVIHVDISQKTSPK